VVALFDDRREAEVAVQELVDAGLRYEDLSIVAAKSDEVTDTGEETGGRAAGIGVGAGAVLGGFGGLVAALGTLAIPGVGPVLAAGPLVAALAGAGIGAAAGGIIGALVDLGVPAADAEKYAEGIRRGGALVVVHADEDTAPQAITVLSRHRGVDIEERGAAASGAEAVADRRTGEPVADRVGEPVEKEGVFGGRGVRAYAHTRPERAA
jgi:hypothetical protein